MKNQLLFLLAVSAFVLGGCSAPTHVDKGPIKAKTFAFVNGGVPPKAEFAENGDEIHRVIQAAIAENLTAKGLTKSAQGVDLIVAYLIVIGNGVSTEGINTYFGYGRGSAELVEKAHDAFGSSKNPNYYERGTLLIDLVDARTFKLLKRNFVVRPALRGATAEVRAAQVKEAVDAILADLKIEN